MEHFTPTQAFRECFRGTIFNSEADVKNIRFKNGVQC